MGKMKDSGIDWIGDIPQEWNIKKLKFSCKIRNEKYTENKGKLDYFGLENIVSWNGKYVKSENIYDLSGANLCYKNDVVFGKLRPYLAKTFLVDYDRCCSSEFAIFYDFIGNPKYYLYLFTSQGFVEKVNNSTYGTKMPRANIEFIKNIFI
ncbi:MAG: restriction endonuclease subunit S, partial [Clostridia bacterium]|nr:restriction endonuclease subunit S [Clostridia bacterium]